MFRVPEWKAYWYDYYWWHRRVRTRWPMSMNTIQRFKIFLEKCIDLNIEQDS